jgi:hypothetical protein
LRATRKQSCGAQSDWHDKDRVDVIVTNPPFGGEEERGILTNFPETNKRPKPRFSFSSS